MSSVSPSTDSIALQNYYTKAFKDLQDASDSAIKREKASHERQVDDLEANYKTNLSRREADQAKTIEEIRNETAESGSKERQRYIENLDKAKEETHRAQGGNSAEQTQQRYYKGIVDESAANLDKERKSTREQYQREVDHLLENQHRALAQAEERGAAAVKRGEDIAGETLAQTRERYEAELDKTRAQNYNSRGQLSVSIAPEVYRKELQDLSDASDIRHAKDQMNTEAIAEDYRKEIHDRNRDANNQLLDVKNHHAEELTEKNEKQKVLEGYYAVENRRSNDKVAEYAKELERSQKSENSRVADTYKNNLDSLQKNLDGKESYFRDQNRSSLKANDLSHAQLVSRQNLVHRQDLREMEGAYQSQVAQLNTEKKQEEKSSEERVEAVVDRMNAGRQQALDQQAKGYQATLESQNQTSAATIDRLQQNIQKRMSSTDLASIPDGVESRIRQGLIHQYEKTMGAEIDKNRVNQEQLRERYSGDYLRAMQNSEDKETRIRQDNELEKTRDRTQFYDTITDTEFDAQTRVRESDASHEHELDKITRQFSHAMDRQRREYENMIEIMKADSEAKMIGIRQDGGMESKAALKAFTAKQNELIRDNDQKLSDLRSQYELQIEDLKSEFKTEFHDIERRSKVELENQAKGYDQRIAQLEEQNKEHERYIAQNYQEQLDKSRHAYELIAQQKKS